jgi:glycosyltransferase involved in cell wall biosynthesis
VVIDRPLYVAFVGMRRAPSSLAEGYFSTFVRFHLELPWYYARHSRCHVHLTTSEPVEYKEDFRNLGGGTISSLTEGQFLDQEYKADHHPYDVIVHWRRWHDELYVPGAKNVILSQDHSYSDQWKSEVTEAFRSERLDGILVFPTWHKSNTARELSGIIPPERLYEGMTLGVDTDIYQPAVKNPFKLLWASDPGRGLDKLMVPFMRLWQRDRRFNLTVTYPDYVKPEMIQAFSGFLSHPGVTHLPSVRNGSNLWNLFNESGFLPYSSSFPEPSSRCHRQAMSAGCVVLYPPNMGTPSCLIEDGMTGIVADPEAWPDMIQDLVKTGRNEEIGHNARTYAVSESWAVQAKRFFSFFSRGIH